MLIASSTNTVSSEETTASMSVCLCAVDKKAYQSSTGGPLVHQTMAKGHDESLAHGPDKKLLL